MYTKLFLCAWQRLAFIAHITKANHGQGNNKPEPSDKIHKFLTHKLNYALFFPNLLTNLQPQMQSTNYVDHKYKISTNFDT